MPNPPPTAIIAEIVPHGRHGAALPGPVYAHVRRRRLGGNGDEGGGGLPGGAVGLGGGGPRVYHPAQVRTLTVP